ncbi:MAG: hypothetical protein U0V72_00810 [Cytophagales bacterium]
MNKQIFSLTATVIVALGLATVSCKNDKKTATPSTASCTDTSNVTFSTIKPILTSNCANCHSGIDTESGFGAYSQSNILGTINHTAGYSPMPKNGSKLSDCDILKIQKYYNSLAK